MKLFPDEKHDEAAKRVVFSNTMLELKEYLTLANRLIRTAFVLTDLLTSIAIDHVEYENE